MRYQTYTRPSLGQHFCLSLGSALLAQVKVLVAIDRKAHVLLLLLLLLLLFGTHFSHHNFVWKKVLLFLLIIFDNRRST